MNYYSLWNSNAIAVEFDERLIEKQDVGVICAPSNVLNEREEELRVVTKEIRELRIINKQLNNKLINQEKIIDRYKNFAMQEISRQGREFAKKRFLDQSKKI
tara:strand:- start:1973 stop:2278 length:306 start_codon:yes stop_codon:yes gene_type:complete